MESHDTEYVVGLDGCSGGWFAVWSASDKTGQQALDHGLYEDLTAVFDAHTGADRIVVDIPIGLSNTGARECDVETRRRLGVRGSSVFPAPCRAAVEYRQTAGEAASYDRANELQREQLGSGISRQAWNITDKIAEMDLLLRETPPAALVVESHPEYCFAILNDGYPIAQPKSSTAGRAARFGVLSDTIAGWQACYETALSAYYRKDVARDDIIDALILAVAGQQPLCSVPNEPPTDEHGLPMQIVAPATESTWSQYLELAEQ